MKADFKKTLDAYQAASGIFRVVDVPPLQYLAVDGRGDPNTSAFADAISTLFPVGYKLKFASKQQLDRDYVVMPLEALWWAEDMDAFTARRDKSAWQWTALMMVPDWITPDMFDSAVATVAGSRDRPARLDDLRLETLTEGRCVQTLHIGSFDDEAGVLDRMHHEFIPDAGLRLTGKHHEIYLSDFRRVEPAKLRTILRQPVLGF
ncbi:GyrI-like domain-containing protein [Microbacterium sp. zg-YB36]|uniref:GyrI-like domain-containing protein n=1 Tax=Microbacterium sp. zg-YB36 TaxID=2969407 RepID=UPI00214C16A9|nr:GyrI-like domain-containing protein [Microbacterium sp. zg-YB36]MDL5350332.1 GyrI-like domain-containing protein [Microbacterium sp. zg-YB36]